MLQDLAKNGLRLLMDDLRERLLRHLVLSLTKHLSLLRTLKYLQYSLKSIRVADILVNNQGRSFCYIFSLFMDCLDERNRRTVRQICVHWLAFLPVLGESFEPEPALGSKDMEISFQIFS